MTRGLRRLLNRTLTVTRRGDVTSTSRGGIPVYEPLELGLVKGRIEAVGLGGRPIQQTEITTSPNLEPVVSDFHAVTELTLLPATPAEISGGVETALDGATLAGADEVAVDSGAGIVAGTWLRIGSGTTEEHREVSAVAGADLTLAQALLFAHADDTAVVEIEEPPAAEALDLTERDVLSDDTGVYDVLSVARADGRALPHHYEAKLRKVTA